MSGFWKVLVPFSCVALIAPVLEAAECPPPPDLDAVVLPLMADLRGARDARAARAITNQLWALWATAPDVRAQELLDLGLNRRAAYDFRPAWDAFDQLVAYCPDYAEGYNQRAFVAFLQQHFSSALDDLEKALELDPDHIAALSGKAMTLIALGREAEAQDILRQAVEMNPWLPERGLLVDPPGEDI